MSEQTNASFGLPETPEQELARVKAELADAKAKLAAQAAAPVEPVQDLDSQGFAKEYVKLMIFKGSRPDDLQRVPVGIRGYVIQIERGPEVIVHKAFAEVLEHAIEDVTISGDGGLVTRPAHRFPFQIKGPATEEEYLSFQAQMKAATLATAAAARA